MIYNNQNLKKSIFENLKKYLGQRDTFDLPKLIICNFGSDLASAKYIKMKVKMGALLGLNVIQYDYDEFISELHRVPSDKELTPGLIIQLPLQNINQNQLLHAQKVWYYQSNMRYLDVDFLSGHWNNQLWKLGLLPPTIQAIDYVLKDILKPNPNLKALSKNELDLRDKTIAIVGQGELVGKFMANYCINRGATVISINKYTLKPQMLARMADIVICATGVSGLIDLDWLKPRSIVIDAGTSEVSGAILGDLKSEVIESNFDGIICKSPGGIGPITVLSIFENLIKMADLQKKGLLA